MKTLITIFFSLFLANNCQNKKEMETKNIAEIKETNSVDFKTQETDLYQYEAMSRGYFLKITFKNNQIFVTKDQNDTTYGQLIEITKADLKILNLEIAKIDVNKFPNLIGKSKNRLHDGAAHGNFNITTKGETITTQGFDHGNPPTEIAKLVSKMIQLAK